MQVNINRFLKKIYTLLIKGAIFFISYVAMETKLHYIVENMISNICTNY